MSQNLHNPILIKNSAEGKIVEIDIEGPIGGSYDWWTDERTGATKEALKQELKNIAALKGDTIIVNINSYGGDVNHGISIHDLLAANPAKKEVRINGMTASAATIIAMAGDTVKMSDNSLFLAHKCSGICWGNSNELAAQVAGMDKIDGLLANIYAKKTGKSKDDCIAQMSVNNGNGEWLTADEAKDFGFINEVFEPAKLVASVSLETLAKYNLPAIPSNKIKNQINNNSNPQNEKPMKSKSIWAAMSAFLASAFPGFKADETELTPEHLEKMNGELATLAQVKADLQTAKEANSVAIQAKKDADATIETLTAAKEKADAEVLRLGALNPGSTNTKKDKDDKTTADESENEFACETDSEVKAMREKLGYKKAE